MTTLEVLKKARALVEKGWCQYDMAQSRTGRPMYPLDEGAVKFCAVGAVEHVYGERIRYSAPNPDPAYVALCDAAGIERGQFGVLFNDAPGRTQAEVLAVFDRAIKAESKR